MYIMSENILGQESPNLYSEKAGSPLCKSLPMATSTGSSPHVPPTDALNPGLRDSVGGEAGSLPGAGRVSPVMWEDLGEVIVVSGTSEEVSTSLRVFGERIETGWEHPTRCKERRKVGTPFPKGELPLLLILRPCPSGLLSHSSWAGMRAHGPRWNSLDLRKGPLQDHTPVWPTLLPSVFCI